MPLKVPVKQYPICPEGVHVGVCIRIIDIGTHTTSGEWGTSTNRKLRFDFVIPGEKQEDGKPFEVGTSYTFSTHKKATLRKVLGNWRGKTISDAEAEDFDVEPFLGKAAQVQVGHSSKNGRKYANVDGLMPLPKGTPIPKHECDLIVFSIEDDPHQEIPSNIPKFFQEKIRLSPEWRAKAGGAATPAPVEDESYVETDPDDSDVPF